ncbi:MAG: M48 family metallopeptidase [Leptospirillia bacterium]
MNEVAARYFDGRSSRSRDVGLRFTRLNLEIIEAGGLLAHFRVADVSIIPPLGNTARIVELPDGGRLEVDDHAAFAAALARAGTVSGKGGDALHRLEGWRTGIVVLLLVTLLAGWGLFRFGIPLVAERIAQALPPEVDAAITAGSMEQLDRLLFSESELGPGERERTRAIFDRAVAGASRTFEFELLFRKSESLGANAIALPGGTVVVTDALVRMAEADGELYSIFAHEAGHVMGRHALRHAMQQMGVVFLIGAATGDPISSSSLAATLPTVLMEAKYSQDFEREADRFAYERMLEDGVDPGHFVRIMSRIAPDDDEVLSFISTHPPTDERVRTFQSGGIGN